MNFTKLVTNPILLLFFSIFIGQILGRLSYKNIKLGSSEGLLGCIVGKRIIKLNTIQLLGSICGAMTSTPGLAASMEATDSDDVTVYYGAAYPFALLFKIIFTNILFKV